MGDGFLEMDTAPTREAVSALAAAGAGLRGRWAGLEGRLADAEGRLGGGPMGQAFLGVYGPGAPATAGQVVLAVAALDHYSTAGATGVDAYVAGDEASRAAFEGLG